MRAALMLCEHAQVENGKLFILGGGWDQTTSPLGPTAMALQFFLDWDMSDRKIPFSIVLMDQDGRPVVGPDMAPIAIGGEFIAGREGTLPGAEISIRLAINLPPLGLPGNTRYTWVLNVDGEERDDWRLSFGVTDQAV